MKGILQTLIFSIQDIFRVALEVMSIGYFLWWLGFAMFFLLSASMTLFSLYELIYPFALLSIYHFIYPFYYLLANKEWWLFAFYFVTVSFFGLIVYFLF